MLPNGFPPAGDGRRRSSAPPSKELTSMSPVAIPWLVFLLDPSLALFDTANFKKMNIFFE